MLKFISNDVVNATSFGIGIWYIILGFQLFSQLIKRARCLVQAKIILLIKPS